MNVGAPPCGCPIFCAKLWRAPIKGAPTGRLRPSSKCLRDFFFMNIKFHFNKFIFLLAFLPLTTFSSPLTWRTLAPGLEYTEINTFAGFGSRGLHVFRFDLQKYAMNLAFTQTENRITTVANLVTNHHAVIGINGGFFTPERKPLGLRIAQGQVKSPLKNTSWWGVFYTQGNQAFIVSPKNFQQNKKINFAVQSGPRLIVNGQITQLKPGADNRTALGITRNGKVILAVTSHFPLSTQELAQIMQAPEEKGGLNCANAINLDGGSSTQLYARINNFELNVPSLALVSDAVLVVPK